MRKRDHQSATHPHPLHDRACCRHVMSLTLRVNRLYTRFVQHPDTARKSLSDFSLSSTSACLAPSLRARGGRVAPSRGNSETPRSSRLRHRVGPGHAGAGLTVRGLVRLTAGHPLRHAGPLPRQDTGSERCKNVPIATRPMPNLWRMGCGGSASSARESSPAIAERVAYPMREQLREAFVSDLTH